MGFGALAPEVSSGRMHSGPGPGSLVEAAKAWQLLAGGLDEMAARYQTVITCPSAAAHLDWLHFTAAQARHAAIQATAAAGAYGSALAAMVAPHVVIANRSQRASMVEENCLGQFSAAIADTDADYEQMWSHNAATMYAYARRSANASKLTPFRSPPPRSCDPDPPRNWKLVAAPQITSAGQQVISAIPAALDSLSASPLTTLAASMSPVTAALSQLSSLAAPADSALGHLNALNKAAALNEAETLCRRAVFSDGAAVKVSRGSGASIAGLSVPRSWGRSLPHPEHADQEAGHADHSQR
jgi:PPE-repeat protein